ncbi:MAG: FG-GAP repeat protein [Thermoplasmata archaeon]|nr:FG-GAP repeat protein [Thermoplasmata archaeon]
MRLKLTSVFLCLVIILAVFAGEGIVSAAIGGSVQPPPGAGDDVAGSDTDLDTTPPEALIKFDLEAQEIILEGADDFDEDVNVRKSVQSTKNHRQELLYELTDDAGNELVIIIECSCLEGNLEFSILELKYSTGEHIVPGENHYKVEFKLDKKTGEITHLHQNIHVVGQFKLNLYYTQSGETTSLEYEEKGCDKVKHKVGGLGLVNLNTDDTGFKLTLMADGHERSLEALRPGVQRIDPAQLLVYDHLVSASAIPPTVRFGDISGVPEYISGRWATDRRLIKPELKAADYIETYGELFRLNPKTDLLKATEVWNSELLGLTNVRLQQYYQGVPVFGSELLVHLNRNHDVTFVNGVFVPGIKVDTKPRIGVTAAKATAETDLKINFPRVQIVSYEPEELVVYHRSALDRYSEGPVMLGWKVVINTARPDGEWYYLINARTGELIEAWNNYQGSTSEDMPWAELLYLRQPGAIQEAYAAVFEGSLDLTKPLSDPRWDGELDHWDDFVHYRGTCDLTNDNCGVRQNSAILTKLFRLIAYGGSHYGLATDGVGVAKTKLVFRSTLQDTGLSASATFQEFRDVMRETGNGLLCSASSGWSAQCQAALQTVWLSIGLLIIDQTFGWETNDSWDEFGKSLTTGDFNNDTFQDLAIGIPYKDANAHGDGMVMVFYGSPGGLRPTGSERLTMKMAGAPYKNADNFGWVLTSGDFNGDGYDELAIGVPHKDIGIKTSCGIVVVYFGSAGGLVPDASGWPPMALPPTTEILSQIHAGEMNEVVDHFGYSLAAGDFDNDSYDDLAVGVPNKNYPTNDEGIVIVFYGTDEGLRPDDDSIFVVLSEFEIITQGIAKVTAYEEDEFGFAVAAGNFDGDDYTDLAVGVPYDNLEYGDAGRVVVFYGSSDGLLPVTDKEYLDQEMGDEINGISDRFGYSLGVGNFNDDIYDDLVVGIPYEKSVYKDSGAVMVFYGSNIGFKGPSDIVILDPPEVETLSQKDVSAENETDDRFGWSFGVGDFDADGYDDLAVGSPYENEDLLHVGRVDVFFGSEDGLKPLRSNRLSETYFGGTEDGNDEFGWALVGGDFDGNGLDKLAVSAPKEGYPGDIVYAGKVYVRAIDPALPWVNASAAIVYSRTLDKVLGFKYLDEQLPMASTTKIMTALLTIEFIKSTSNSITLNSIFDVSDYAATGMGGSHMQGGIFGNLSEGDTLSLKDLLYGLMLPSGNDASVVIAENILWPGAGHEGGWWSTFMTIRAASLGLTNTNYRNPFGEDATNHYTSAYDLAKLADFALEDQLFRQIVGTWHYMTTTWTTGIFNNNGLQQNTNQLLRPGGTYNYTEAYGVKTGTTDNAGQCLVSAANDGVNDIIAVVLHSAPNHASGRPNRYSDTTILLDWGLAVHP